MTVIAGALADIAIGVAILWRPTSRYGLWAALAITLSYVMIGTVLVPRLWSEPLGPMAENLADPHVELGGDGDPREPVMLYFAIKYLHVIVLRCCLAPAPASRSSCSWHICAVTAGDRGCGSNGRARDFLFTASAVASSRCQACGFASSTGYSLGTGWIALSIALYILTGRVLVPSSGCKCGCASSRPPRSLNGSPPSILPPTVLVWFAFGFPAFAAVLAIFLLMIRTA